MKAFYSDHFILPLPEGHRFPIQKYELLRQRAVQRGLLQPEDLHTPEAASDEQLLRIHTAGYLEKVKSGRLTEREIRRIGFPWSLELVERSRRSVGGTIAATRTALRDGAAVNLAGGTHHAYPEHGEGFCVFNDVAVAARAMQVEGYANRILIIDTDVHQGNGTAAIFSQDDSVFTFSIHCARNFPFHKEPSDLDIALADGAGDEVFLKELAAGLERSIDRAYAALVIYVSGADPFQGDRLGRLDLTQAGLRERDRMVYDACFRAGLPAVTVMAGGYGRDIDETVEIHLGTIEEAGAFCKRFRREKPSLTREGYDYL